MTPRVVILLIYSFLNIRSSFGQLSSLENLEALEQKGIQHTLKSFFKDFTSFGMPFQMAGGLSLNLRSYDISDAPLRQDPFLYTVGANINLKFYQLDLPFSMIMTAKNSTKSYPSFSDLKESLKDQLKSKANGFARFGMSPKYKWAQLHLGHRSMNFSKYTVNNINFFGAGMMLQPDKYRIGVLYGRLSKAEPINLSLTTPNLPVYQRIGWGTKLGYGDDKASVDFTLFKASDDSSSINIPGTYPRQVSPEANLVLGVQVQKLFLEKIRLKLDYTNSAISPNILDADAPNSSLTNFLLQRKNTTYNTNAIEASLAVEGKVINAGVSMSRIDPNFKTFGAYFFNNDIMDIQGFANFGLFEQKLNNSIKIGSQSNNLKDDKPSTTTRLIYDIQSAWSVTHLSIQGNYSNNSSKITYVLNQQLDSLNAVVATEDLGVNIQYTLPFKSEHKHTLMLTGNMQNVSDDIEKINQTSSSKLFLSHLNYSIQTKSKWSVSAKLNYTKNEILGIALDRLGYGFGVRKDFLSNKLSTALQVNFFQNKNGAGIKSSNVIGQLNIGLKLTKGLDLQLSWARLSTNSDTSSSFVENTGNLGIFYHFNYTPKATKK